MSKYKMQPRDVERVLNTARKATHVRVKGDGVWREIVAVENTYNGDIRTADPKDPSKQTTGLIFVNMNAVEDLEFAVVQIVPAEKYAPTEAEKYIAKLTAIKEEAVSLLKDELTIIANPQFYLNCLHSLHESLIPPAGWITDDGRIRDWFVKQGCTNITYVVARALSAEVSDCYARLASRPGWLGEKTEQLEKWPRWLEFIDFVLGDLQKEKTAPGSSSFDPLDLHEGEKFINFINFIQMGNAIHAALDQGCFSIHPNEKFDHKAFLEVLKLCAGRSSTTAEAVSNLRSGGVTENFILHYRAVTATLSLIVNVQVKEINIDADRHHLEDLLSLIMQCPEIKYIK